MRRDIKLPASEYKPKESKTKKQKRIGEKIQKETDEKKVKRLKKKYEKAGDKKNKVVRSNSFNPSTSTMYSYNDPEKFTRQTIRGGNVKKSVSKDKSSFGPKTVFNKNLNQVATPNETKTRLSKTVFNKDGSVKRSKVKVEDRDTGYSSKVKSTPKRTVKVTKKDGVKTRQVIKDGTVKKTVTRTPGGVEKEIERGNKRIEVRKYKDEGVKNRTVINMKKAKQNAVSSMAKSLSESAIKGAISGSAFRNLPSSMVKEAMKPENNVMMNNKNK